MVSGNLYRSKIFFSGGINNNIFTMKIPSLDISDPCNQYDIDELKNKCNDIF